MENVWNREEISLYFSRIGLDYSRYESRENLTDTELQAVLSEHFGLAD